MKYKLLDINNGNVLHEISVKTDKNNLHESIETLQQDLLQGDGNSIDDLDDFNNEFEYSGFTLIFYLLHAWMDQCCSNSIEKCQR